MRATGTEFAKDGHSRESCDPTFPIWLVDLATVTQAGNDWTTRKRLISSPHPPGPLPIHGSTACQPTFFSIEQVIGRSVLLVSDEALELLCLPPCGYLDLDELAGR
jgi:hypothetical protein